MARALIALCVFFSLSLFGDEPQRKFWWEQRDQHIKSPSYQKQSAHKIQPANFKIEGGVSYFYPQSHLFRKIYGGGADYDLKLSQTIYRHLDLWAGVNYFYKCGHSLGGHEPTSIKLFPVSLGLKYFFPVYWKSVLLEFYLNGAFKYYFLRIHNRSDIARKYVNGNGLGGVFGIGSYVHVTKHFFLDFLIDYSFKNFSHLPHASDDEGHSLQVGGWDFGFGLGFQF